MKIIVGAGIYLSLLLTNKQLFIDTLFRSFVFPDASAHVGTFHFSFSKQFCKINGKFPIAIVGAQLNLWVSNTNKEIGNKSPLSKDRGKGFLQQLNFTFTSQDELTLLHPKYSNKGQCLVVPPGMWHVTWHDISCQTESASYPHHLCLASIACMKGKMLNRCHFPEKWIQQLQISEYRLFSS